MSIHQNNLFRARPRNRGGFCILKPGELEMLGHSQGAALGGLAAAGQNYGVSSMAQQATAPRELGLLERAIGVNGSLESLKAKLETLSDRIAGNGSAKDNAPTPIISGLPNLLSHAEDNLRRLHQIVDGVNDAF